MDSIDYTTLSNFNDHYQYLVLAMVIYQPPLRTSYYSTCKIIRLKKLNNKIDNFILLSKRNNINKTKMIINKDKASNYKVYNQNK